ncbi:MAG: hypothetical protein HQL65_06120 [Magnetococcales bacterium]|nr:hypothetical protein [Magnetococcales bacterium]
MGQIVIPDVDETIIQHLEQQAALMHMTLGESLRKMLVEIVTRNILCQTENKPFPVQEPVPSEILAGCLQRYAKDYIPLKVARERLWAEVAQNVDSCR